MIILSCGGSGSSGNCYSLTDESGKILLLDAGIPLPEIKRLVDWKISDIVGCFVSHGHLDHSKSTEKLRKMGIHVFEPYKTDKDKVFGNMIKGFKLVAFRLPHDGESNFGSLVYTESGHRMAYLTDMEFCPYIFRKQRLNTILMECNYTEIDEDTDTMKKNHVYRGHCSLETCKAFLKANQTDALKNVILCHLSSENANESEILKQVQETVGPSVSVTIAKKEVSIEL